MSNNKIKNCNKQNKPSMYYGLFRSKGNNSIALGLKALLNGTSDRKFTHI